MGVTTATACRSEADHNLYKTFASVNIIIAVSNIVTNAVLTCVLWKLKKLNTISFKFIFVQALSDILIGISMLASRTVAYMSSFHYHCQLKRYADILCDSLCTFSGVMVLLVALDRYIHMRYLNRYSAWMTKRRAIFLVISNSVLGLSMVVVQAIVAFRGNAYSLIHMTLNGIAIGIIVTASTVYFYAFRSLNMRTKQLDLQQNAQPHSKKVQYRRNPTKEFLKAMVSILTLLLLTFTPFVISSTLMFFNRNELASSSRFVIILYYVSRLLVCMNSSLNAITYIALNRELRKYVLRVASFGSIDDSSTRENSSREQPQDQNKVAKEMGPACA